MDNFKLVGVEIERLSANVGIVKVKEYSIIQMVLKRPDVPLNVSIRDSRSDNLCLKRIIHLPKSDPSGHINRPPVNDKILTESILEVPPLTSYYRST